MRPGSTAKILGPVFKLTLRERGERRLAPLLTRLPRPLQVGLAGGQPVEVEGSTLDPGLQLLFSVRERLGVMRVHRTAVSDVRERMRRDAAVHAGPLEPARTDDLEIPGPAGPLRARRYRPVDQEPRELFLFLHGGGFVVGDLDTYDPVFRMLCAQGGVQVLAADYRLAPESPFPAAIDDARAVLDWALANAGRLGADPDRVAVGGDSAGANLIAVACQSRVRDGGSLPALQLLVYPAVDRVCIRSSHVLFSQSLLLTRDEMEWCHAVYLNGAGVDPADPRVSPLCGDLRGLPPTLIYTAGFDPLRDEGEDYARALRAAGVPVALCRFDALAHGFMNLMGVSPACREASHEIAREVGKRLRAS